jgi:hypothetical protein
MMRRAQAVLEAACVLAIMASLYGCSSTNLADIIVAAGKDPATVCGAVMTPYGNLKFARTNITNGDVQCTQDGLSVKSQPPSVPVGVQVIPATGK